MAHLKNGFARHVGFVGKALVQGTADHHGDDLIHIQPFQRLGGDPLTVAQNSDLVAQLENLFHLVRDINNAAAAIFQLANNGEQVVHLFLGQRRGRLVHDDDFGVIGERLGDFDHLHLRNRKRSHFVARIDIDIQLVENRFGIAIHFFLIDERPFLRIAA